MAFEQQGLLAGSSLSICLFVVPWVTGPQGSRGQGGLVQIVTRSIDIRDVTKVPSTPKYQVRLIWLHNGLDHRLGGPSDAAYIVGTLGQASALVRVDASVKSAMRGLGSRAGVQGRSRFYSRFYIFGQFYENADIYLKALKHYRATGIVVRPIHNAMTGRWSLRPDRGGLGDL